MEEKIRLAKQYVRAKRYAEAIYGELLDIEEEKNNAANIYADNKEEYEQIWAAIADM